MSSSDITVAALTATPTLRGNKCAWTYSDPRSNALPNIGLDMVEVWESTTNDRATATKVGEGITDFTHGGLVEETTYYYWIKARDYLGAFGAWYPSGATAGVSARAMGISGLAFGLANGKLVATVAGNALTIALKTTAGNDPSVSDPIFIGFADTSASGTAQYRIAAITSAMSLVISSGSTLGASSGVPFKLWVVLFDDAGTLRLAVINCLSANGTTLSVYPLVENQNTTGTLAEGGAGGADSAGIFYASQATGGSKKFRVLGSMEWTSGLSVAGTWDAGPNEMTLVSPGDRKPGETVQEIEVEDYINTSTILTIPFDDTKPQESTEGLRIASASISPVSRCNLIETYCEVRCSHSIATQIVLALFKNLAADAIAVTWGYSTAADTPVTLVLSHRRQAATVSTITFTWNIGGSGAGTCYINSTSAGRKFGGVMPIVARIRETAA